MASERMPSSVLRMTTVYGSILLEMKKLTFIRYGGLSSVVQKGYRADMPGFHSPPARRGIYAFPWPYVEHFLLGSITFVPTRMVWVRDKDGNRIGYGHPDYESFSGKVFSCIDGGNYFLARHIKPKKFTYDGDIWHHIQVPRRAIILEKGGWFLSRMEDYREVLPKEVSSIKRHNCVMDHLEVFLEKV